MNRTSSYDNHSILESGFRFKNQRIKSATIYDMISHGKLNIFPEFRSHREWPRTTKSKFIESVILGIPTTDIVCEENMYGELTVLDGTQRLKSLVDFMADKFPLKGLRVAQYYNGCYFSELTLRDVSKIKERYFLGFSIVTYDTHPLLKFEYYKRINITNTRFSVQSARNYAYSGMYNMLKDIILECSGLISFEQGDDYSSNDLFLWENKVDQFFLYLICILLIKDRKIDNIEMQDSISDILDQAAYILDQNALVWVTLDSYVKEKVSATISKYYHGIKVNIEHEYASSDYRVDSLRRKDNDYFEAACTMEGFIHLFINTMADDGAEYKRKFYDIMSDGVPPYLKPRSRITVSGVIRNIFRRDYD